MNLANEGLEARKKEDEVNAKKRKAEEDARWEGGQTRTHMSSSHLLTVAHRDPRATSGQLEKLHKLEEEEEDKGRHSRLNILFGVVWQCMYSRRVLVLIARNPLPPESARSLHA